MLETPKRFSKHVFFDDGKLSHSRQYIAMVTRIYTLEDTKDIQVAVPNGDTYSAKPLYDVIHKELADSAWLKLYAPNPDTVVAAVIPRYDDHIIYFLPTQNDGWFSINVQSGWQAGRLDTQGRHMDALSPDIREALNNNTFI